MKKLTECPVCKKTDMKHYITCQDHMKSKQSFTLTRCNNCTLIATNPRPELKDLDNYYDFEDYISHSQTKKGLINKCYHIIKAINTNRKVKLLGKQKGSVLEIGSGTGYLLNKCRKKGWETVGVEHNMKARENANRFNDIELISSIDEVKENSFERIMMWHVLEHIADINEVFKSIKKMLKKEGKLIIAIPNPRANEIKKYKENWAAFDVPRHLYHFEKQCIETIAERHDFEILKTKPMWFDALYISMLSEKIKSGKNNYIKGITTGLWSNIKAFTVNGEYSSLIYILTHKEGGF